MTVDELRARLAEREDAQATYLRLCLERDPNEATLARLEAAIEALPPASPPAVSPLGALHQRLRSRLESRLTVADDKKLQLALQGEESSPQAWRLLLSNIEPSIAPQVTVPLVISLNDAEKDRTRLLLQTLERLARHRTEGTFKLPTRAFLEALQSRSSTSLKNLLASIPDVP